MASTPDRYPPSGLMLLKVGADPVACSSGFQMEVACSSQAVNKPTITKRVISSFERIISLRI